MTDFVLIGNPNCGKTTLFNALTGSNQKIGNWPGVTVEKKEGDFEIDGQSCHLTDIPGLYSLAVSETDRSQDERIAAAVIDGCQDTDLIINVVDACRLERHLYLTSQLIELQKPMIVVLNMMDLAQDMGMIIDIDQLAKALGCPVIPIQAHKKKGLTQLLAVLKNPITPPHPFTLKLPASLITLQENLTVQLQAAGLSSQKAAYCSLRMLEGDRSLNSGAWTHALDQIDPDADIIVADARYQKINHLVQKIQKKSSDATDSFTAKVDRFVLHRFFGIPFFLAIMYLMFFVAINVGGAFQDFFDQISETVFVQGPTALLLAVHAPSWTVALFAKGIGKGINTTVTFVPVMAAMYFCLALLETSGYMARAAFVVDKIMRRLGLPGKAFVPMIVGFGCNVPAVMAARTLDNERDRLLTILMTPFMSCSARLAIYAVFVAAFFPRGGQNIVFMLYLIGIAIALCTGRLLRKTLLQGPAAPLILDLPAYHKPTLSRLTKETLHRLRYFVLRAGKVIIPVCLLVGGLNALTLSGDLVGPGTAPSMLSYLGKTLTPLFAPMGLRQDNWPATVGLLTGGLAKEVVVGTLNMLYTQLSDLRVHAAPVFDFWTQVTAAFASIPENLVALKTAITHPFTATLPPTTLSHAVYGMMVSRFDGQAGAFAYLLFVLLYIPCISTIAAIRQEASAKWMVFSVSWSLLLAYGAAVIFYQAARFFVNPLLAISWISLIMLLFVLFVRGLTWYNMAIPNRRRAHVIPNT